MKTVKLLKSFEKLLRDNSPAILTAIGISGTITTAYLAGKASFKAAEVIDREQTFRATDPFTTREKFDHVWELYIPTAISGAVTIGCIVGATKVNNRRTAAITAAYSLSEKAFSEYREKVIEKFGERKEQETRDEIAQDKMRANPPGQSVIVTSGGDVLCCELYTGRYFKCDMETLRKAQNTINAKMVGGVDATISDFYDLIGLPHTTYSSEMGWDNDKLMELQFSTVLTDDGKPCLSFEYNYTKPI